MQKQRILDSLKGGDRRSIGRSDQVVVRLRHCPLIFPVLIEGMHHPDELVRMRAADAAEKLTVDHPEWLQPFKQHLLETATRTTQQEVRWHLAQMLPRLELSRRERATAVAILRHYLTDKSRIVRTCSMQGLADLALQDARLLNPIRQLMVSLIRTGSPAMKSRGRRILSRLSPSRVSPNTPISKRTVSNRVDSITI